MTVSNGGGTSIYIYICPFVFTNMICQNAIPLCAIR